MCVLGAAKCEAMPCISCCWLAVQQGSILLVRFITISDGPRSATYPLFRPLHQSTSWPDRVSAVVWQQRLRRARITEAMFQVALERIEGTNRRNGKS